MKKLIKKNLDELALSMPIINEMEQKNFVGGTLFYSENGQLIHTIFDGSNEIRVVLDMNTWLSGGIFNPISGSYSVNEVGSNTVSNILTNIASGVGIAGAIAIDNRPGVIAWVNSNGQVFFNMGSSVLQSGNYYDILSVLNHENHHQQTMYDHGSIESEIAALEYEMALSTFHLTSPEYRSATISEYNRLKNL